jgi:orotidine-5'-phosphate decarboxylase
MLDLKDRLIVALDVDDINKAKRLIEALYPTVKLFKVGSQLFTAAGPEAVKMVGEKGGKVFLDLKFYDIPNTVFSGVVSGTGVSCEMVAIKSEVKKSWPVFMMTVYIDLEGDKKMLERAVEGAKRRTEEVGRDRPPYIVGVTVLTSSDYSENTSTIVLEKAKLAKEAGLDGVVCSAHEAAVVREACGRDFIIVTPGIRPKGYKADDQKRTATAQEAINAGANYIVVGRPILEAKDPLKAIDGLL